MSSKQDNFFVLEVIEFVFRFVGKPLPLDIKRKIDKYSRRENSHLTENIKQAVMSYINDRLHTDMSLEDVDRKEYEVIMGKLLKHYTHEEFLKFISSFSYGCLLEFMNRIPSSPETYYYSLVRFLESLRNKGQIGDDLWKLLDECAVSVIEEHRREMNYKKLRKSDAEFDMTEEKGFILKVMYLVFDFYYRDLPSYLREEFDQYTKISRSDPHIKNAVYVLLKEVETKIKLVGDFEPIVLHYNNLASFHFTPKYFLEFCVYGSKKTLIEFINEKKPLSPRSAYDVFTYLLLLAKEDGKFSSLEDMNDAASIVIEEDRARIEYARAGRLSIDESSGSNPLADSSSLIGVKRKTKYDCRCCTLH